MQSSTPITIDCYWVYKDGPRHGIFLVDHRSATASYEVSSDAKRNNGGTYGITQTGGGQTGPTPGNRPGSNRTNHSNNVIPGNIARPATNPGAPGAAAPAAPNGPYRGWLIVGYDATGNVVGSFANLPEFLKLAPGAPKHAAGLEGPSGLNRPNRGGGPLKTGL